MAKERLLSRFAQRFVARKLAQLQKQATHGTGLHHEQSARNFTDNVDRMAASAKRADLRDHILSEAAKTGHYFREEAKEGQWAFDNKLGTREWNGKTPDAWKEIDFEGQWVRKSTDERARYIVGHYGEDSRTRNDYPGTQVEKNGVVGPVKWGPGQPTGQDAQAFAEKMLDRHLGFEAPKLEPRPIKESATRGLPKALGAKIHSEEYKKYVKESAAVGTTSAQKYGGASDNLQRQLPPPSRSR